MTIGVIATLTVAEGKNAEFEAIFAELVSQVNENEPGCNFYQVYKSRKNPQVYVVLEQYRDQESLDAHGVTEYFRTLGKQMGPCMAAAPEIEFVDGL
ncbi:MAG: antibiotic biosynthesis monooxygenase [Halieaceae bacterium]|jgi:quinol monooxygenase YgiN|nr:antibiotic biosynthesis monooxygenase [Halieaceae bacterium]